MSFQALAWAVSAQPGSPADKLVLLGLADRHNTETNVAYPSLAWLEAFSGLYRKTVIASLDRLIEKGFIADTGQRTGRTKQVKVYSLKMEEYQKAHPSNGVVFHGKQGGKAHQEPIKEPNTSGAKAPSVSRATLIDDFIGTGQTLHERPNQVLMIDWARKNMRWTGQDCMMESDRFIDSARAANRRYVDWMAAWRNWCRSPYQKTKPADDHDNFKWGKMPKLDHARAVAPKPTVLVPVRD